MTGILYIHSLSDGIAIGWNRYNTELDVVQTTFLIFRL